MATIELMDRVISALNEKFLPISIFMDLSKAFDTLDHDILLGKLRYYGINGTSLDWFRSYLSNQKQYVGINNERSSCLDIKAGAPQGSILGPLLFLIYMNYIPNVSQAFRFIFYADDATPHTDKVATKLSKYSGILNKLKNYLPPYILKAFYNSLVQTHLNYASATLVWDFKCNRLVKLQKRLVRIITCSKYNAHTDPLFKSTEILKVANILDLNALKFHYKYLHGKLLYFYSFNIVTQGSQHSYNTRQSEQIRTERTRAEYCDNRLIFLPYLINTAPLHLLERISTHSIQGFSSGIKSHFLNLYPTECPIANCYICHHNQ